eukprot:m.146871 g.146871  ORF g.146871 m.146871 type:complete len:238 (+) comp24330_c0_seq11:43-756(+)
MRGRMTKQQKGKEKRENEGKQRNTREPIICLFFVVVPLGFKPTYSFLPTVDLSVPLYKLVFHPHHPTIAFVGTARPVFGSIPSLAELQARWVAKVFAGHQTLPGASVIEQKAKAFRKRQKKLFPYDCPRLHGLVDQFEYADLLMSELKAHPRLWRMFFRRPGRWFQIYANTPWTPFLSQLENSQLSVEKHEELYQAHLQCRPKQHQLFHVFNLLFLGSVVAITLLVILLVILLVLLV